MEAEIISETSITKPVFDMDVEVKLPKNMPKVEHNLSELESYAEKLKEFYSSIIIRKEDIKDAEAESTKVNKLIEQVKRLRIDNINKYKEPIEDFEKTAKNIESLLADAKDVIKVSLTKYEDERKNKKLKEVINPIINNIISNAFCEGYLIDVNRIEQSKRWFNKTIKDSDIEEDIQNQVNEIISEQKQINEGIEVINKTILMCTNESLNKEMYIERFKYTKDLTSILNDIERDNNNSKIIVHNTCGTNDIFDTQSNNESNKIMVTFKGTEEQVERLRKFANEIGMEEL